jgi:hypothetical protein
MSRQYFADVLTEPANASFGTITATTEQILIPTVFTPIPALEPRAGKVYLLECGGTCTTGAAGTLIINARYATTITTPILATSPTQNYVPSITNAPFYLRAMLMFRSMGLGGANSVAVCTGWWQSGGAIATAASATEIGFTSAAPVSVDASVASALCVTVTFSVAPSVIPFWHVWRSLN